MSRISLRPRADAANEVCRVFSNLLELAGRPVFADPLTGRAYDASVRERHAAHWIDVPIVQIV